VLRTVTFSDPAVAEAVNKEFVAAWHNRSPGFYDGDSVAEKSIFQNSNEAYPTQNICTFILAPDGKVFHYVAGYLAPELFLKFLEAARELCRAGFDERMTLKPGGLEAMQAMHAERSRRSPSAPSVAERRYRGAVHRHSERCEWVSKDIQKYFVRLHQHWAKVQALPGLDQVRYSYLYGNSFTEEAPGAAKIAADPTLGFR